MHEADLIDKFKIPINIETYEKIIIALENDIGKGEMIPENRALYIIKNFFSKFNEEEANSHSNKIYNVSRSIDELKIYIIIITYIILFH